MVVLVGKAGHQFDRPLRDVHPGLIATTEVLDGHAHQFPGLAFGVSVVELHMFRPGDDGQLGHHHRNNPCACARTGSAWT